MLTLQVRVRVSGRQHMLILQVRVRVRLDASTGWSYRDERVA